MSDNQVFVEISGDSFDTVYMDLDQFLNDLSLSTKNVSFRRKRNSDVFEQEAVVLSHNNRIVNIDGFITYTGIIKR